MNSKELRKIVDALWVAQSALYAMRKVVHVETEEWEKVVADALDVSLDHLTDCLIRDKAKE